MNYTAIIKALRVQAEAINRAIADLESLNSRAACAQSYPDLNRLDPQPR